MHIKKNLILLTLFVLSIFLIPIAESAQPMDNSNITTSPARTYNIHMFKTEQLLATPLSSISYWFELPAAMAIQDNCYTEINYDCSETLKTDLSMITVFLNDIPLSSRALSSGANQTLQIKLPKTAFHTGFNEIKISVRQRSIDAVCQDTDNPANWTLVYATSLLHLETTAKRAPLLSDFPYPFFDVLARQPISMSIIIPDNYNSKIAETILNIASSVGNAIPGSSYKNIRIIKNADSKAITGAKIIIDTNKIPVAATTAVVTSAAIAQTSTTANISSAVADKSNIPSGNAYLTLASNTSIGANELLIAGSAPKMLQLATDALTQPELRKQLKTSDAVFNTLPSLTPIKAKSGKKGLFTLAEFGYNGFSLVGAFHQKTSLVIPIPRDWTVTNGSYLDLQFKHSPLLKAGKSALTIYINGVQAKGVSLNASNIDDGLIRVPIDLQDIMNGVLNIDIETYHDLSGADCSKRYDEAAWTYFSGESQIFIASGSKHQTISLNSFPRMAVAPGIRKLHAIILLPNSPSEAELALAGMVAARAGQNAGTQIVWHVRTLSTLNATELKNKPIFFINSSDTKNIPTEIKDTLPIFASGDSFIIKKEYPIIPSLLAGSAFFTVNESPWNPDEPFYTITYTDDTSLEMASNYLADPALTEKLTGEVAILDSYGEIDTFKTNGLDSKANGNLTLSSLFEKLADRNNLWWFYAIFILLVLLIMGIAMWIGRRKAKRGNKF